MSGADRGASVGSPSSGSDEPNGAAISGTVRLGQDIRFVMIAVGGGAIRVARPIARRHLRHLETVAINCDPRVQDCEEFDRRVCLIPEVGGPADTCGSPLAGAVLARAAEPALRRLFDEAHFVTIIGSLGGGAGSGVLPNLLELASERSRHVTAFVLKPFACEGERRAIADRTIGRIHLLEGFSDLKNQNRAALHVLDNQSLVGPLGSRAFRNVSEHWAQVIGDYVEQNYLDVAEAFLHSMLSPAIPATTVIVPPTSVIGPGIAPPAEMLPPIPAQHLEAELTFEVHSTVRPPPTP